MITLIQMLESKPQTFGIYRNTFFLGNMIYPIHFDHPPAARMHINLRIIPTGNPRLKYEEFKSFWLTTDSYKRLEDHARLPSGSKASCPLLIDCCGATERLLTSLSWREYVLQRYCSRMAAPVFEFDFSTASNYWQYRCRQQHDSGENLVFQTSGS